MARGDYNRERRDLQGDREESRPSRPGPREMWRLILATYRTSLPYLLIFLAGLLLATWVITELVF
ncbi:MAG: hypothetical protein WD273_14275 [Trueperaceae bacterium]